MLGTRTGLRSLTALNGLVLLCSSPSDRTLIDPRIFLGLDNELGTWGLLDHDSGVPKCSRRCCDWCLDGDMLDLSMLPILTEISGRGPGTPKPKKGFVRGLGGGSDELVVLDFWGWTLSDDDVWWIGEGCARRCFTLASRSRRGESADLKNLEISSSTLAALFPLRSLIFSRSRLGSARVSRGFRKAISEKARSGTVRMRDKSVYCFTRDLSAGRTHNPVV